jgi:hypothetical protein
MSRFKDFGSKVVENLEPISFKIWDEEFSCVPQLQGKVLLDMVSSVNTDSDSSDASSQAKAINDFFSSVLTDESEKRFNALLTDKERIVSVDTLGEIVGWLVEQYTNRPTERSQDS